MEDFCTVAIIIVDIVFCCIAFISGLRTTDAYDKELSEDYRKLKDWSDLLEKYNTLNYISPDVKIHDDEIDAIMEKYRDKPSPTQH